MGQGGVGKTAMVLRFTTGDFNEQVRRALHAGLSVSFSRRGKSR
jgi:GTPase SAR1 family protein